MTGGQASELTQDEAFARIRLLRSPNIGPVSYRQLLRRCGSAQDALRALPDLGRRGTRPYTAATVEAVEKEIAAVRRAGARYLFHDSADYPALLGQLSSAPPILTWRGDITLAAKPCVAVVGARNASAGAVRLARQFAQELAAMGFSVVSGLARGIDGAAHEGALCSIIPPASGSAPTIGVIASGIDVTYPPQHLALQEQVATQGLLLAEQPAGTQPQGRHFPSRNRIIAGLCVGTLVVEAAPKSGSLITARLAAEAGREVMAIPGSPLDARSLGCNQLIREGAILVQSPSDVAELVSGFDGVARSHLREMAAPYQVDDPLDEGWGEAGVETGGDADKATENHITGLLSKAPVSVDEIVRQSGAAPGDVQMVLLELEISGLLQRHAAGRVSLI